MFNIKLYTTFNLLFIVIFFFKIIYKTNHYFWFQTFNLWIAVIIVYKKFENENGVLGLERDVYLSIVKIR
jgi:hypothetical protein